MERVKFPRCGGSPDLSGWVAGVRTLPTDFRHVVIYSWPDTAHMGFSIVVPGWYLANEPGFCPSASVLMCINCLILARVQEVLLGKGKCQKCKVTLIKLTEIKFPCWLPAIENPFVSFLEFPVTNITLFISFYQTQHV